ncbi:MAG: 4-(cytidine 5'-diphospho)-2-C-methyl-D-erythritol kinase [Spirochaetaceae bacterium]|jgi:4-diphosphocytidyl-2-C-methyl-D-erythritol kinase|nr:4-(cytidine 5'-diphospho)-2-C-methyl-D-erythritol kinase [Spirochaetaceae bacterium]
MNPRQSLEVPAPCKINVHLRIKNRRADGYHALESIFLALAFGDVLRFEEVEEKGTQVTMDWRIPEGPIENNSVLAAAALFRERTGFGAGIRIQVEKRIPLGAGLGGGSSDAAATLKALNRLAGRPLKNQALQEMAEKLGSDVPFFLSGGAAWVSGRGEKVAPLPIPQGIEVLLVYPGFPSDTKKAFRLLDEVRSRSGDSRGEEEHNDLTEPPAKWKYRNDFLPVLLSAGDSGAAEAYRALLGSLTEGGADFTGLSGSGSTCFGVFTDTTAARKTAQAVGGEKNFVQLTFPLAHFAKEVLE